MTVKEKRYSGKTKNIYTLPNGNLWVVFKDDVTGEDGVVDPGANTVMGQIKGKGRMSLELTNHFFKLFEEKGIPTHLVAVELDQSAMEAKEATPPGKDIDGSGGLEFVCRPMAYGSFLRRYTKYAQAKQKLDYLVEITLKDDERGDPLINDDALVVLGLLSREQLERAKALTRQITQIVEEDLRKQELTLVDMKVEFGLIDDEVVLIDEVSADCMRVMDRNGSVLTHQEVFDSVMSRG